MSRRPAPARRATATRAPVHAPSQAPGPLDPKGFSRRRPDLARGVARALLEAALGSLLFGLGGCLPPDFEIEPAENHPVSIDKSLLTRSPDQFQDLSNCEPRTFDVTNAIVDADANDPVTIAWMVDYQPGQSVEPDANNRLRFTFDPCTNPKAVAGKVSTIEVLVLDRVVPLDILADVDKLKAFEGDDVTTDSVVWFVGFDDRSCCL